MVDPSLVINEEEITDLCVVCFVFGCINDYDEERASDGLFGNF